MSVGNDAMRIAIVMVVGVLALSPLGYAEQPETQTPILAGGQISKEAISLFLARPVDEVTEVRQGDQLLGKAHVKGEVSVDLKPNPDAAAIDVRLQGVSRMLDQPTGSTAALGKMDVESQIDARKSIVVDLHGLATKPATADCQASLKKLESLGFKDQSFAQKLLQGAERLASKQAEKRVEQQLDDKVDQAIEKAAARLRSQPWLPLDKASTLVEMLAFSSTSGHAGAQVLCGPDNELPAGYHVRELDPSYDVHVLVHEALVGSVVTKWCSGKRIQDHEVLHHVQRMRGRAPWALWVHARRPRWAVTLSTEQPFAIRFDENKVHIRVRIGSVEYDGDVLETPVEVSVVVQPQTTNEGHHLHRCVEPVVTFLDGGLDPQREKFAAMLQQKFDAVFPEETYFDGLKTPSSGSWTKFLRFELADFSAEQGWFSLAFRLNEADPPEAIASEAEPEARR